MDEHKFITKLLFYYHPAQQERFRSGELVAEWNTRYPGLFDEDDLRIQQTQPKYHFFEWLASVLLYEATGYHTLMEKYETASHDRKIALFKKIVGEEVYKHVLDNRSGVPDLFVYSPDHLDWFFCEVKGASDRLRPNQILRFEQLYKVSQRKICVLSIKDKKL